MSREIVLRERLAALEEVVGDEALGSCAQRRRGVWSAYSGRDKAFKAQNATFSKNLERSVTIAEKLVVRIYVPSVVLLPAIAF
ncbi:hypothetical protein HDU85_003427 [Gaertneriomyces sp. JEL0708]|nr:hypothetical protein HDU85_003427 [Gaertneriomyces sp. JEL0708]